MRFYAFERLPCSTASCSLGWHRMSFVHFTLVANESSLVKMRLGANLCFVCIDQIQKTAEHNGPVRFFPCGNKLDSDIIRLQIVKANTIRT